MRIHYSLFVLAIGCSGSGQTAHKLPGVAFTPHLTAQDSAVACGDNITLGSDSSPDALYTYSFDGTGLVTHAVGVFPGGGPDDAIDYTYDGSDNLTSMVEAHGFGDSQADISATYDPTNGLTDYTWAYTQGTYNDSWTYVLSSFVAPWEPAHETITEAGQPDYDYDLTWDADGRLTGYTDGAGNATTYTYDDAAGTITMTTNNGAFTGLLTYDDGDRLLSEVYGGSDPNAWASSYAYAWNGDQLLTETYSSGTQDAPKTLTLVETDAIQYNCPAARVGRTSRFVHPSMKR